MSQPQPTAIDCIFEHILGFMLPFLLSSAGGDANMVRTTIQDLAQAYNAATATELELVGRLLGFSIVAMDNLRLSMNRDMSDTKVLRYRSNAVALSRAGEQCRKILEVMQGNRKPAAKPMNIPSPSIAPAPPPNQAPEKNQQPRIAAAVPSKPGSLSTCPAGSEAAKREARMLLAVFAQNGGTSALSTTTFLQIPNPAAAVDAAVRQAFVTARPNAAA